MRRSRRSRAPLNAEINVTSLVDVAFVLLVIFMIAAPMMQGGVQVNLPVAAARPLESHAGIVVTVNRQGRVFVDEAGFSYEEFKAGFRALVTRRHPTGIYLRADRGAPYGDVVRVLAVIRTAGVENVGLVTEPEEVP